MCFIDFSWDICQLRWHCADSKLTRSIGGNVETPHGQIIILHPHLWKYTDLYVSGGWLVANECKQRSGTMIKTLDNQLRGF